MVKLFCDLVFSFITGQKEYYSKRKYSNTNYCIGKTLDSKDTYTAFHSANVSRYAVMIAGEMNLPPDFLESVKLGGELHDIGKIGISEKILKKPGSLTTEEYEIIKSHTTIGYNLLNNIDIFKKKGILDAILYHHEREDGRGYPEGLKGEDIPLISKIIAVADSFEAMTSSRVYREENSFEYAVEEIRKNRGKLYDPKVVDAFLAVVEREEKNILTIQE